MMNVNSHFVTMGLSAYVYKFVSLCLSLLEQNTELV